MFDSLQQGLSSAFKSLAGKGKLTESNMRDALKDVQTALLEADVSFDVVKKFMADITEQAVGEKVLRSLDPGQQLVGIVHHALIDLMGAGDASLHLKPGITTVMLCGLQGSGKTTTCGKLARLLQKKGKKPLLVAADLQRPAAIDQLHVLGDSLDVPVYSNREIKDPVKVCREAATKAKELGVDVIILDTAGRLHIDDELMGELQNIDRQCNPDQVVLVVDGMTGQDAVNSAKAFNEALELNGVIITKLDSDARAGVILSVKSVADVPVKYIGVGEKIEDLEEFHADRMAGRILGMGDTLTLVEKAQQEFDEEEQQRLEKNLQKGEFTLDDFKKQLKQIRRLGPLGKVLGMLPGMGEMKAAMDEMNADEGMNRLFGIIDSMTQEERRNPMKSIDQSRRRRIAAGAGVEAHEVNDLVKQFDSMASMMKQMAGQSKSEQRKMMKEMQQKAMADPTGKMGKTKQGTGNDFPPERRKKSSSTYAKTAEEIKTKKTTRRLI